MGGDAMSAPFLLITPPHDYLVVDPSQYPDALDFLETSPCIGGLMHLNEEDTNVFLRAHPDLDAAALPKQHEAFAPSPKITRSGGNVDVDDEVIAAHLSAWAREIEEGHL